MGFEFHRNEFYVQKRTMSKDYFPGFFGIVVGGVVNNIGSPLDVKSNNNLVICFIECNKRVRRRNGGS